MLTQFWDTVIFVLGHFSLTHTHTVEKQAERERSLFAISANGMRFGREYVCGILLLFLYLIDIDMQDVVDSIGRQQDDLIYR